MRSPELIERPEGNDTDDWSADDVETFADAAMESDLVQELREGLDEEQSLSDDEAAAVEALANPQTTTIELRNGVDVEVREYLSAAMEDKLDTIAENRNDLSAIRSTLIDVITWLILDDQYGQRGVWETFADQYGTGELATMFDRVAQPAIASLQEQANTLQPQDAEAVDGFRQD